MVTFTPQHRSQLPSADNNDYLVAFDFGSNFKGLNSNKTSHSTYVCTVKYNDRLGVYSVGRVLGYYRQRCMHLYNIKVRPEF
jgi:hypothetical protein